MRHIFIYNPAAGKRGSVERLLENIRRAFPEGDYELCRTEGPGDARDLARRAVQEGGPVRLYACGGDGTLNEVVNGAAGYDWAAVTNVPLGTGNDFLRIFGKQGRERFTDIAALRHGPQGSMDLMECNGRLGLDVVCAGLDARVAANVSRYKALPLVTGMGAYILGLAAAVCQGITQPMDIRMGDIHYNGPTAILCICNGQYYGGGFRPAPEAMPDDGVFDVLLVGQIGRLAFIRCVRKYAVGRYKEYPELIRDWHGERVDFSSPREIVVVVDGEVIRGRSFTLRRSEKKLNFFWPQGAGYRG